MNRALRWLSALAFALLSVPVVGQTTFTNSSTIVLPAPPGTGSTSNAVPGEPGGVYPSPIVVSGLGSSISKVTVTINDFRHVFPDDIDILLVGPQGQSLLIWSDVGGLNSTCGPNFDFTSCTNQTAPGWAGPTVVLDDAAATDLTAVATIVSGSFKPTNVGNATDMFPFPAPAAPYGNPRPDGVATLGGVFNGTNPNGTWNLYVIDDAAGATGRINGGWSLTITTAGTPLPPTTTTITGHASNPSDAGQMVVVTYAVTSTGGTPAGTVMVGDGVNGCAGTVAGGACALALSTPGDRTLTVSYQGSASFAPSGASTVHRVLTGTTTTITAHSPNPSGAGQAVAVSYTVAPAIAGGPAPSGNVTVSDGVNSCTGTVAAGSCNVALNTSGARTLSASYAGDGINKPSVSAGVAHQVAVSSTTSITSDSPSPSDVGQAVTVGYSVTGPGGTPTGNVTVSDGVNACTATVAAGSCVVTFFTPGDRTVTATYPGDANFGGSAATITHRVRANTTTAITADTPDPSGLGQAVAVTFTVTPTAAGGPAPTGNVTVTDGVNSCTGTLAAGGCSITLNTSGARTLTATYAGDSFNKTSTSAGVAHVVKFASFTSITADTPNPSDIGANVTISFAVTGAGGTPTGNVTVGDGVNSCTGTVAAGACVVAFTTPGERTVTATYAGDASYAGSSTTSAHRVRYNTTTAIVADTPDPSGVGQPVAVSFTVTPTAAGGPAPTGNVTVTDGVTSCTGTVAAGTCSITLNVAGARTLTATYAGDAFNKTSTSPGAAHGVKYASSTTITADTPNPSDVGASVTIGYAVTGAGGTPTGNVTVSDGVNSCTGTLPATQCAVAFSTPGERTVTATYAGDASYAGSSGTSAHRVRYNTTTAITADTPDPSGAAQPVTVSFTVTPTVPGGPAPTGNVTVTDGTDTCVGTATAGTCSISLTSTGNRTLTATYAGDGYNKGSTSVGEAHTVKKASTTTITSMTPNPSDSGTSVTVVFTVSRNGPNPGGNVTVSDGVNSCTATVATGQCAVAFVTPGDRTVTATYAGDSNYGPSSGTSTQRVRSGTTTTIVADTPDPSSQAQAVTVSFSVAPTAAGGPAPTGTVSVTDGVDSCTGTVAAGACAVALSTLGSRTLSATYAGDNYYVTSVSAGVAHQVVTTLLATTTAIVSDTPDPSVVGQPYMVSYSVTVTPPGTGTPTGTVTVSDGVVNCTGTLPATSCQLTGNSAGARSLIATYNGSASFSGSASAPASHQVNKAGTTTAIVADTPDPSVPSQPYTVTYSVAITAPGAGMPTGTVTVSDGSASCTGTLPATSCQLTSTAPGAKSLAATYNGDANFNASFSATAAHQVNKAGTATAITADPPDPSVVGQPYTVTYDVTVTSPGTGTPTGTVTVSDGTASCTGTLPATSCQLASISTGAKSVTATYNGDANFSSSVSAAVAHQVNRGPTATAIVSDTPDPSLPNQSYTVTWSVTVMAPGAGTLTGTVTVTDGAASCTGTLPATSCQLTSTTAGAKTLAATYNGDGNFNSSVSATAAHQVNQMGTSTAITADTPDPSVAGQAYTVSYSVAVTPPGTGTPTGTVTVTDGVTSCTGTLPATTCQLTSAASGARSLTATYNGDANFGSSVSPAAGHQVNKAATTATIISGTPEPSVAGQPYAVTFAVAVTAPGAGTPTGTVTVSDGVASCTGTLPVSSCQLTSTSAGMRMLTATYNGDANFNSSVSATSGHQVNKAGTTTAIVTDTPDPSVVNQTYTVSYAVAVPAPGAGTPTGTVTVSDGSASCTGTLPATSCQLTSITPGAKSLTATYNGDANFSLSVSATAAHQVTQSATTTTITGDTPDPSVVGQPYTVSYSVAVTAPGTGTPTGTVTVSDGSASCAGTLPATSCQLTGTVPGARTLSATYSGDTNFGASVAPTAGHQVDKAATTTTIVSDTPDPSVAGQAYTVTYSVAVSGPGAGTPTGTVTVSDGAASCTGTLPATSCQLTGASAGAKSLTATYNGDASFESSVATAAAHQVNKAATTTVIVSDSPDPSAANQAYTVAWSVTVSAPGAGTPTGTVTISDGAASCTGTLPATSCQLTSTTTGAKSLTATYSGDASFNASVSATAAHQVNQSGTTTAITADSPDPSVTGQPYTVSYSVAVIPPGTGIPTGTVTVSDGAASCIGTLPATSCQLPGATAGAKALTATYSGDPNFGSSVSATAAHQVNKATTTTAIVSDTPDPSAPNQAYTVTYSVAAVAPGAGTPTGSVTVSDGTTSCVGTLPATSCLLTSTTPGAKSLTATYNGDANFNSSVSATAAHQVNQLATAISITADTPDPSVVGQPYTVSYSLTVTPPGTGTPTGTVTVSDGAASCTGTLPATSCLLTSTTAGAKSLTATYSGSSTFTASVSATAAHQVNKAATTTAIVSDTPDPSLPLQPYTVTWSVAVAAPGGGTPTGTVTVSDGSASCTWTLPVTSCQLTPITAGTKTLTATYNGDANYTSSVSATATHQVNPAATTTTITAHTPDPAVVGQAYTVSYSVAVTAPGTGTPTGTVTVSDGLASCTAALPATSCQMASTTAGARSLTATYNGSGSFAASTSAAAGHQVNKAATTTVIIADTPDPSVANQAYTVSYSVAVTAPGTGVPTGTVTVSDGSASCTGTLPVASCLLTSTTAGAKSLTATYNGDANYTSSVSATAAHQVQGGGTTTLITSHTPEPSVTGQSVTVAFTVTGAGGTPTGTVTVSDGVVSCTASVAAGQCALALATPGDRPLSASYPGDGNFTASQGAATHRVLYNTTTVVTSHTPNPSAPGQNFTVTYTVTPATAGGPAPTGNVTVSDGVNACTGTAGAGSCVIALTTAGTRVLSASYAGDGANRASVSADVAHIVGAPDLTIAKTHVGDFARGQLGATYTITVTNAGGVPSAGTVTVTDNLPAGLTGADIFGTGWNCTQPAGPCSRSDPLAANASYPVLTVIVSVAADAPGTLTNTATVSGGGDGNAANNTASDWTAIGGGRMYTLTVTKWGSATGTVASQDGGINCGATCAKSYASGATVTLDATPGPGSQFTGWLGACTGTGACSVSLGTDRDVSANFAHDAIGPPSLDIDDNGTFDALTDGILITRYMFGLTGSNLVNGAIGLNANRSDPGQVLAYLDDIEPALDIDGNGQIDARTDGMLALRYLFGMRGSSLVQDATGAGATRSSAQIEAYLASLLR